MMLSEIQLDGWVLRDKDNAPVLTGLEYENASGVKYQVAGGKPPQKIWVYKRGSRLDDYYEVTPETFGMRWTVDNWEPIKDIGDKTKERTDQSDFYAQLRRSRFYVVS